ncbi:MAG: Ig-like domain-containing protein [Eubacteriaceae bacterium]|nr:Ig-like domain-containing protein [Eubacteriaceae bacterium]
MNQETSGTFEAETFLKIAGWMKVDLSTGETVLVPNKEVGYFEFALETDIGGYYEISMLLSGSYPDSVFYVSANGQGATPIQSLEDSTNLGGFYLSKPAKVLLRQGPNQIRIQNRAKPEISIDKIIAKMAKLTDAQLAISDNKGSKSVYGEDILFTARATDNGKPVQGQVVFDIDGEQTEPINLGIEGYANYTAKGLNAGNHNVSATLVGNNEFAKSKSCPLEFEVYKCFAPLPNEQELPARIHAQYGQQLKELPLPDHFRWENPEEYVGTISNKPKLFNVLYNPDLDNYDSQFASAEVVVAKRAITIKAIDQKKFLGQPDPLMSLSVIEGNLVGDETVCANLKYSGDGLGAFDIVLDGVACFDNYEAKFIKGKMVVVETNMMKEVSDRAYSLPARIASIGDAQNVADLYMAYRQLSELELQHLDKNVELLMADAIERAQEFAHTGNSGSLVGGSLPWYVTLQIAKSEQGSPEFIEADENAPSGTKLLALYEVQLTNLLYGTEYMIEGGASIQVAFSNLMLPDSQHTAVTPLWQANAGTIYGRIKSHALLADIPLSGTYAVYGHGESPTVISGAIAPSLVFQETILFCLLCAVFAVFYMVLKMQEINEKKFKKPYRWQEKNRIISLTIFTK